MKNVSSKNDSSLPETNRSLFDASKRPSETDLLYQASSLKPFTAVSLGRSDEKCLEATTFVESPDFIYRIQELIIKTLSSTIQIPFQKLSEKKFKTLMGPVFNFTDVMDFQKNLSSHQFLCLKQNAQLGNPRAQYELALSYFNGDTVKVSFEKYQKYLKMACEQKYLFAEFELAQAYDFGKGGLPQDYRKAYYYYDRTAQHEFHTKPKGKSYHFIIKQDPPKQYRGKFFIFPVLHARVLLGYFYEKGLGVFQSSTDAAICYQKAFDNGENILAPALLARCYELGFGKKKSEKEAKKLYRIFLDNTKIIPEEYEKLAASYQDEEKKFRFWMIAFLYYKAKAEFDDVNAQLRVSYYYRKGLGVEQSDTLADDYVRLADSHGEKEISFISLKEQADNGNPEAQVAVAKSYLNPGDIEFSSQKAKHYLMLAVKQHYPPAYFDLAKNFDEGFLGIDYPSAAHYYQLAAEHDNYEARILLGYLYQQGLGVEKSLSKAVELYLNALQNDKVFHGKEYGCALLAQCYRDGLGVDKSKKHSAYYSRRCCELIGSNIFNKIRLCEEFARVWRKFNKEQSFRWEQKAFLYAMALAECGNSDAYIKIARYFELGFGIDQSDVNALKYYKLAVDSKNNDAGKKLASIFNEGIGFQKIHPKSIVGPIRLSEPLSVYEHQAENTGDSFSQFILGIAYSCGEGKPHSDSKAFEYFQKSAEQNYMDAVAELGRCYEFGIGTRISKELALQCYFKARDLGSVRALFELGQAYLNGTLEYYPYAAVYYFRIAAQHGDRDAQYALGWLYAEGLGVNQSYSHAYIYFEAAARGDHAGACCEAARYCRYGLGGLRSLGSAIKYYQRAYELGIPEAEILLKECQDELRYANSEKEQKNERAA